MSLTDISANQAIATPIPAPTGAGSPDYLDEIYQDKIHFE